MKSNINDFLAIRNSTETTADLYFYGDIVDSWLGAWDDADQYPDSIKNFLDLAKGKDINIYVNSGGGSVFSGMAIYNMLKRHNGYKTVYIDGLAGSIASVIALAGDKVVMPSNAYMMVHKPWCGLNGNATELRDMANTLDKIEEGILNVYKENLADGMVAGAINSTANVLRPALQILKTAKDARLVSGIFVIILQNKNLGHDGAFVFGDCAINQNPNPEELAEIAKSSARSFKNLLGAEPIVAMLSHSTKGSAKQVDIDKVI